MSFGTTPRTSFRALDVDGSTLMMNPPYTGLARCARYDATARGYNPADDPAARVSTAAPALRAAARDSRAGLRAAAPAVCLPEDRRAATVHVHRHAGEPGRQPDQPSALPDRARHDRGRQRRWSARAHAALALSLPAPAHAWTHAARHRHRRRHRARARDNRPRRRDRGADAAAPAGG